MKSSMSREARWRRQVKSVGRDGPVSTRRKSQSQPPAFDRLEVVISGRLSEAGNNGVGCGEEIRRRTAVVEQGMTADCVVGRKRRRRQAGRREQCGSAAQADRLAGESAAVSR